VAGRSFPRIALFINQARTRRDRFRCGSASDVDMRKLASGVSPLERRNIKT